MNVKLFSRLYIANLPCNIIVSLSKAVQFGDDTSVEIRTCLHILNIRIKQCLLNLNGRASTNASTLSVTKTCCKTQSYQTMILLVSDSTRMK